MDWAQSQDLLDIYLSEVDERSAELTNGAAELAAGALDQGRLDDLVRHAHTIKGSSNMMGRVGMAAAAAALERAWKLVRDEGPPEDQPLAEAMEELARALSSGARNPQLESELTEATSRVVAILEGETPEAPTAPHKHVPTPVVSGNGPQLGGLLGSIEQELSGSVTRVDTGDLYRLINRAVEIGLDTEALADLTHVAFEGADPVKLLAAWRNQLERLSNDVTELQSWAVSLANVTFGEAIETFPQFVRFLGRRLGKEVRFEATGIEVLVDRQIVDLLREPLRHLVVNAIDHGIEDADTREADGKPIPATVRLAASTEGDRLVITVSDDGRGIDWDAVAAAASARGLGTEPSELRGFLFRHGFTTVSEPNDFSGTGEGLALVADSADRVGGSVSVDSRPGRGTLIRLDLPVSLVLQNVVIVASGDQFFGIAEPAVLGSTSLQTSSVRFSEHGQELMYQGEGVPVVSFSRALGVPTDESESEALVVSTRSGLIALAVSEIVDRRRVAVKSLGPILEGSDHLTGAAFLGGGQVLVVVDHNYLGAQARRPTTRQGMRHRILVVDDSAGVRQLISATLRGRGYAVDVAASASEAMDKMEENNYDALVVDYSMPRSNGVELVRALRAREIRLPIVMVSAVATEDDKAAAWEAGVDAYLDKFDLRRGALTASLARLLEDPPTRVGV